VANRDENYTRFVVVSATSADTSSGVPTKTSLVMAVGNHPGALMDALAVFREADINLVMLESRPIPHNPREEMFYVDFDGRVDDPEVAGVLDELTRQVKFLKVLGSYPSRDLRPKPSKRRAGRVDAQGARELLEAGAPAAAPNGYRLGSRGHKANNTVVEVIWEPGSATRTWF
jgi:chorismate mutase/prephenate dehydratase